MKVRTCLRYPGGKFYALKELHKFYQIPHDEFREVFAGGLNVSLRKRMAPKFNWINDIDPKLINFYKIIADKNLRHQLFDLIEGEVASRSRHSEVKDFIPKNDVEEAFKFFYLNRTSFSGIMVKPRWGYRIGSSVTPDRWKAIIEPVGKKLAKFRITNLDFIEVIETDNGNSNVLMYLDPPYFKASKAIYNHEFSSNDHERLCKALKITKFKFFLSYEDCQEIREMYDWAKIFTINFKYFMSEGRRQQKQELVITNFDPVIKLTKFLK